MPRTLVAAASTDAAEAGRAVADAGGNAVDAAIAAVIASMTTELGIVSPGAGGFITIWPANDEPIVKRVLSSTSDDGTAPPVGAATDKTG